MKKSIESKRSWFPWLGVALIASLATAYWLYPGVAVDVQHRQMEVAGLVREYRYVLPHAIAGKTGLPLVVALHGALDTTDEMAEYTQLDRLAAEKRFLLVYLQGRHLNWPPNIPEENPDVAAPDLLFFDALCNQLVESDGVDRNRIYVVGVSQGGAMCNLLVARRSERIAAAVCNCGWMPKPLDEQPLTTLHKCPMLFLVGSRDTQVPPAVVQAACDVFDRAQHPVVFQILEGAPHGWNFEFGVNQIVGEFLSDQQLPTQ
ncbi:alpha/beta hydrolase family esterase [Aureliella helgolandensis]|uniref:alpha/beta hydrolase family esterase n=1 Tax=Aureliella helgolandensis TaxID=2527968 RepID=UPI0018D04D41|nr:PHB depolymerase family esterase [Aureliella helgolandensis]